MTKRILGVAIAACLLAPVAVGASGATKPITFLGKYSGTAVTNQQDTTVTINANGTGNGTMIGAGTITGAGSGDTSQRPCIPFTGTGKMTGSAGVIIFKVNPGATSCGDDAGQLFSFTGKAAVLKATGKVLKRKGTLRMSGTYDRSSGAFSVKFSGSLTK